LRLAIVFWAFWIFSLTLFTSPIIFCCSSKEGMGTFILLKSVKLRLGRRVFPQQ
jgi:hypothetical protein